MCSAGTVLAAMVEKGDIDLDADINNYLGWPQPLRHPRFRRIAITPRMLMTHTAAVLPDAPVLYASDSDDDYDFPSYAPEGENGAVGNPACPLGQADQLDRFMQDLFFGGNDSGVGGDLVTDWNDLAEEDGGVWNRYAPGRGREYSNIGAALLGVVMQRAAGASSFEQLFKEVLFEPVGMSSSSWFMEGVPNFEQRAAKHYNERKREVAFYCFIDYPSGSLRTTARDLTALMQVIARGGLLPDGSRLYSQQTADSLTQCQQPRRSITRRKPCQNSHHWFLGDNFSSTWYNRPYNRLNRKAKQVCDTMKGGMFHDGAEEGTGSFVAAIPRKRTMAVLLSNGVDGADIAQRALFDAIVAMAR